MTVKNTYRWYMTAEWLESPGEIYKLVGDGTVSYATKPESFDHDSYRADRLIARAMEAMAQRIAAAAPKGVRHGINITAELGGLLAATPTGELSVNEIGHQELVSYHHDSQTHSGHTTTPRNALEAIEAGRAALKEAQ